MLSYIMIGANDLPSSGRFYSAILTPLGYEQTDAGNAVVFSLSDVPDRLDIPSTVCVIKPYDGQEATVGNGSMTAFPTAMHALVRTGRYRPTPVVKSRQPQLRLSRMGNY